ncbi:MAG: DUF5691 domain-containing protein [Nostocaceae cyanobacterium]|nr:DUF5691 domain-containing protein [Nostocaceae cyanobacterium]
MNLWQDIVSTALIGTERQPFKLPPPDSPLNQVLSRLDSNDREGSLLSTAAAIALYQQAGKLSIADKAKLSQPCPQDDFPYCTPLAGQYLAMMLKGEHTEVLPEWLRIATATKQLAPPRCLPELLALGKRQNNLRSAILPVLGKRGFWLASQNPQWNYVVSENIVETWETGSKEARRLALEKLRQEDADGGRERLEATWKKESSQERANLLQALETGLNMNDEPFLEAALDNKRKQVRDVAAKLLGKLPESRLCQRMTTRVLPLVQFGEKGIEVSLPQSCTPEMIRDGIDQSKYTSALGEKGSLLLQMLTCVPLTVWNHNWRKKPQEIVQGFIDSEWEKLLLEGWATAAINHQNVPWAEALLPVCSNLDYGCFQSQEQLIQGLFSVLSQESANALMLQILLDWEGEPLNSQHPVFPLLSQSRYPWSGEISNLVLLKIREIIQEDNQQLHWQVRSHLQNFALYMEPSIVDEATASLTSVVADIWRDTVDRFLARLQFRFEMIQGLRGV